MKVVKKSTGKSTASKGTAGKGPPTGSDGNLHKRIESERIASDIADYEKSGGKVEKLGVTRVLQNVEPAKSGEVAKSVPQGRPRSR
jgi:hypothetical protein